MDLKRGIDKATAAVVEALKEQARPCEDGKSIAQVGTISANSDETVGKIIAEAMEKVGKEGVITVEEGKTLENELEVVDGMQADLENPLILIHDKKISNIRDLLPILEATAK